MTIIHAIKGGVAEVLDAPPAARLTTAARIARLVATHAVGQLAYVPFAVRALATAPTHRDVRYSDASARATADIFVPSTPPPPGGRPVAILVHGGTWAAGDKWQLAPAAAALAREGVVVAAVNYALWPAGCIEEAVAYARAAVAHFRKAAPDYGGDGARVTLVGHSAGGHLALAAALAAAAAGEAPPAVAALAGVFDLTEHYRYESGRGVERLSAMARAALGPHTASPTAAAAAPALEAASPLAAVVTPGGLAAGPLAGFDARLHAARLSRVLLIGGGADDVVPASQSTAMAAALTAGGAARVTHVHAARVGHADFVTAWGAGRPAAPWADALVAAVTEA